MKNKTEHGTSPFWDLLGMRETEMKDGHAEVQLDITDNLLQRRGSVHGGVLATMIDASIGSAVRSTLEEGEGSVTVEIKVNYLKPAKGRLLVAKALLSKRGRTLAVGQSEVWDDKDHLVATGTGTFIII